jgi:hypothetical protein
MLKNILLDSIRIAVNMGSIMVLMEIIMKLMLKLCYICDESKNRRGFLNINRKLNKL